MVLADLVRRLGEALVSAVAPAGNGARPPGMAALGRMLSLLPVEPLLRLFEGRATVDDDLEIVEQAARLFAAAFPPEAMAAREIEMAVEALKFLLDAAGAGGRAPKLEIAPGEPPLRGGFPGARGHV